MPHSAASDLGLHCLPITLLRVSQLQWVKCLFTCLEMMYVHTAAFGIPTVISMLKMHVLNFAKKLQT